MIIYPPNRMIYICLHNFFFLPIVVEHHTFWQSINRAGRVTMGTTSFYSRQDGRERSTPLTNRPVFVADCRSHSDSCVCYMYMCNCHFASGSCRPTVRWDRCYSLLQLKMKWRGNPLWAGTLAVRFLQRKGDICATWSESNYYQKKKKILDGEGNERSED